jgi:hypothetical protein
MSYMNLEKTTSSHYISLAIYEAVIVHDMEVGCCLGSEGNGVSLGEGVREDPAPLEAGKISSQCLTKAGTTWARTRKTSQVGRDEGGSALAV